MPKDKPRKYPYRAVIYFSDASDSFTLWEGTVLANDIEKAKNVALALALNDESVCKDDLESDHFQIDVAPF